MFSGTAARTHCVEVYCKTCTFHLPRVRAQVWDLNKEAQPEVGRDYHLMLASNVLHTATDLSGEDTVTGVLWCPASAHLQRL